MRRKRFGLFASLTREQKLSLGVLSVISVVTIVLAFVQVRRSLLGPFTTSIEKLVQIEKSFGPTDEEIEAEAKRTDSDGDGLSNWHEEMVFRTSPYLNDTDSDGVLDNIEIAKGTDPNCPEGQQCASSYGSASALERSSSTFIAPMTGFGQPTPVYGSTGGTPTPLVPDRNPAAIRLFLKSQGMSPQEVDSYTDTELMEAFDRSNANYEPLATSTQETTETDTSVQSSINETIVEFNEQQEDEMYAEE